VPRHPSSNTDPAASNAQTSGRADNNPGPQPWEDGLTIDEGVTWMIADEAGLDGRALAKAGQAAHTTLRMLRAAARAPSAAQRKRLAERAAATLAEIKPEARAILADQVTARVRDLSGKPSVNPETGLQEFASPMVMRPGMAKGRMEPLPLPRWDDLPAEMVPLPAFPDRDPQPETVLFNSQPANGPLAAQPTSGLLAPSPTAPQTGLLSNAPAPAPPANMPPLPEKHPRNWDLEIHNPSPSGGVLRDDPAGSGKYWSRRTNPDGTPRPHEGLDITVGAPGDAIVSPIDGFIKRRGIVYSEDEINPQPNYDLVEIQGTGKHEGIRAKVLYVDRNGPKDNESVVGGETVIGHYQDLHKRHDNRMQHHVHLETSINRVGMDPSYFIPNWNVSSPGST
jgi:hypothetical protein